MMANLFLGILLLSLLMASVFQIRSSLIHGCCGGSERTKRVLIDDRDLSHYPYKADLMIAGMHCRNCAIKAENTLNSIPGVYAKVNLETGMAEIHMKTIQSTELLCDAISRIGYSAHPAD